MMESTLPTTRSYTLPQPRLIQKEDVAQLSFPRKEVLTQLNDIRARRRNLELATKAGNLHKMKYHIIFEDRESVREVYTTIWATTEKNIMLKHGIAIPIQRIHKVSIY